MVHNNKVALHFGLTGPCLALQGTLMENTPVRDKEGALKKLAGREALLLKLENTFRRDGPRNVERMRKALGERNMDEAALASHKLKGEAETIGALRVGEAARAFHEAAGRGGPDALRALLPRVEEELEAALAALSPPAGRRALREEEDSR